MPRWRLILLVLLATVTFGSLLITGGVAWYLRSGWYRAACAQRLSAQLGLPADIAHVRPRTHRITEFDGIRVWLPERRDEVAHCRQALAIEKPTPDNPDAYELELDGGRCEISTRTWLREDYRMMLESGLRPGFDPTGPRRVRFRAMRVLIRRDQFEMVLDDASGRVLFDDPQLGRATAACNNLNGYTSEEPVTLQAEFSPLTSGIRLNSVTLDVPELPIRSVALQSLTGLALESGTFLGRVAYHETATGRDLTIAGKVLDVPLAECTAGLFEKPWRGVAAAVELDELSFVDDVPQRIHFRGLLTGVVLEDLLEPLGLAAVGGEVLVRVRDAAVSHAGIDSFIASARCDDLDLASLTSALEWGTITGRGRVVIDDITIVDNRLVSLDAEIHVAPAPPEDPNYLDRTLLATVLQQATQMTIPRALLDRLPERIPYSRLGVRLEVRDELLDVLGTHGPKERCILTVRIAGQDVPAIFEPADAINLTPQLDELRVRLQAHLREALRRAAERGAAAPADSGEQD
jgi:hypothetical protein